MNVLHIGPVAGGIHLMPEDDFLGTKNRFRDIIVDDPEDVYGPPLYEGPAWRAPSVLAPGTYYYVYTDEEEWDI